MTVRQEHHDQQGFSSAALRWSLAGLIASAALIGVLTLVLAIVVVVQPAGWVQTVLGVGLALGAGALAWLVASALGSSRRD